jgi:hypothetical protein
VLLHFRSRPEPYILVAAAPVWGKTVSNQVRALSGNLPDKVGCLTNESPRIISPFIGLGQEKVRIRTGKYALELVLLLPGPMSFALPSKRLAPSSHAAMNIVRGKVRTLKTSGPSPLLQKHVAVLAAFAVSVAAYPEIERIIVLQ